MVERKEKLRVLGEGGGRCNFELKVVEIKVQKS